ncbi:hypothetical protein [Enterobacter hormaechei]|uniref:hypothetical protein n=1 Tax=Enterobacter hormaechei TaxID=158836 RepID=UPI003CEC1317
MTIPQNEKSQHCCFNFRRKRLKQKDLFLTMSTRRHASKKPCHVQGFLLVTSSGFVAGLIASGAAALVLLHPAKR